MANGCRVVVGLHGRFPEGADVALERRVGDWYAPGGAAVKRSTVQGGYVEFPNVPPGRYWAAADVDGVRRAVAVTAKTTGEAPSRPTAQPREGLSRSEQQQLRAPAGSNRQIVTGARSSQDLKFGRMTSRQQQAAIANTAIPAAHVPNRAEDREEVPAPSLKQAEALDVPQRSATAVGAAVPRDVEGEEPQPKPSQQDVDAMTPQRSATGVGEATPKSEAPDHVPGMPQEEAEELEQRSATEEGQAEPVPQGRAVDAEAAEDSPQAAAAGGVVEGVAPEDTRAKARRDTRARRAAASKREVKKSGEEK